jgi:hypothetical protein
MYIPCEQAPGRVPAGPAPAVASLAPGPQADPTGRERGRASFVYGALGSLLLHDEGVAIREAEVMLPCRSR